MKFYIASSLKNKELVKSLSKRLVYNGYIHTYDWTLHKNITTLEELKEIGQKEKEGIMEADFVVVLLPAGKGSHIELGIALGTGKKIYLYSPDKEVDNVEKTSTFYHLREIEKCYGTLDDLFDRIHHIENRTGATH